MPAICLFLYVVIGGMYGCAVKDSKEFFEKGYGYYISCAAKAFIGGAGSKYICRLLFERPSRRELLTFGVMAWVVFFLMGGSYQYSLK